MAEGIFEKPATEGVRLIERLSTEFDVFLMLLSAILAADVSLYLHKEQNVLMFNWKFGGELAIGAILTFVLLFSFIMTFISTLIITALHWGWSLLPDGLTSLIDHNKNLNYAKHGYELDHELERHALSEKDAFLIDLVRRHRERVDIAKARTRKRAQLAVSVIVLTTFDWWISQADRGTFVHTVWDYAGTNALVTFIFCVFGILLMVAIREELAYNHREPWVFYPPGARQKATTLQPRD